MFKIMELVIIIAFLYLVINFVHYLFCKETRRGGLFGLSNYWITNDWEAKEEEIAEIRKKAIIKRSRKKGKKADE
jgi:hypothetical protein